MIAPYSVAILGESSIEVNKQQTFLSPFSFLPRLLPAPQALIGPRRPGRLEPEDAVVVGRKSGNYRPNLNPVAHILHEGEDLEPFEVRWVSLRARPLPPEGRLKQKIRLFLQRILNEKIYDRLYPDTTEADGEPPVSIEINLWGPLTFLALFGFFLFAALLALSVHFHDGFALLATLLLGALTTLIQFGCWNRLKLPAFNLERNFRRKLPPADVVVRYPNGSFVIVKCSEKLSRKLYLGTEKCDYVLEDGPYRIIALVATFLLITAIISLGNAKTEMQVTFAASYIVLNVLYWLVAAIPVKFHWKRSSYKLKKRATQKCENYTEALWTTIALTGTAEWVGIANLAPRNSPWNNWVREAQEKLTNFKPGVKDGQILKPDWDEQEALTRVLNEALDAEVQPLHDETDSEDESTGEKTTPKPRKLDHNTESATFQTVAQEAPEFALARAGSFPAGKWV